MLGTSSVLTVNGTVLGVPGFTQFTINIAGSTAALFVNGDILGNTAVNTTGVNISGANATASITGNIYGGTGTGGTVIANGSNSSITLVGTANTPSNGLIHLQANGIGSSLFITGTVTGQAGSPTVYGLGSASTINMIGSATAGTSLSHAIRSDATSNGVVFDGDMTDHPSGSVAVYCRIFRMSATNSGVTKYANTVGFPAGTLVSRVSPDNVTGMAQIADVRLNTIYGYNNELTGTVAIPAAQSVAFGVPVDATTGTAEFDLGRVAEIIGLQVAAGATEGTSF
jgi:hypothetical protein